MRYTSFSMNKHILQSPEWGQFKTDYGTPSIRVGEVQYTKHKIPFTKYFYGYCPRVNPFSINFEEIKLSLLENNCIALNIDVPNILKDSDQEEAAEQILQKNCVPAFRTTFAKSNVLLDLTVSEEALLAQMHHKQRYNIKVAQKNNVEIKLAKDQADFDIFFDLLKKTSDRQKYYIHSKVYYQKIWELLKPKGMCEILTASYNNLPLASWMLFKYENVLYYPYGGSSEEHKNLFGSTLLGWEAIKYGKHNNCVLFDMWGASDDVSNTKDSWWGFTNFKLKFGGKYVQYINSYDFVVNETLYHSFNLAQDIRWKLLKVLR